MLALAPKSVRTPQSNHLLGAHGVQIVHLQTPASCFTQGREAESPLGLLFPASGAPGLSLSPTLSRIQGHTALLTPPYCLLPAGAPCQPLHAHAHWQRKLLQGQLLRLQLTLAHHVALWQATRSTFGSWRKVFKYFSFLEAEFTPLPFSPLCGRRCLCRCHQGGVPLDTAILGCS